MPGVDKRRVAALLVTALAVVVWNVVFDHVIVEAGRAYLRAADAAVRAGRPYVRIDDWMRPARVRAFWTASASALAILIAGFASLKTASRKPRG